MNKPNQQFEIKKYMTEHGRVHSFSLLSSDEFSIDLVSTDASCQYFRLWIFTGPRSRAIREGQLLVETPIARWELTEAFKFPKDEEDKSE